jgi:hypothetical protein
MGVQAVNNKLVLPMFVIIGALVFGTGNAWAQSPHAVLAPVMEEMCVGNMGTTGRTFVQPVEEAGKLSVHLWTGVVTGASWEAMEPPPGWYLGEFPVEPGEIPGEIKFKNVRGTWYTLHGSANALAGKVANDVVVPKQKYDVTLPCHVTTTRAPAGGQQASRN